MELIGATFDRNVDHGPRATPELGRKVRRLDFELLDGIDGRAHDLCPSRLQVRDLRIVVEAIQQVVVHGVAKAVGQERGTVIVEHPLLRRHHPHGQRA